MNQGHLSHTILLVLGIFTLVKSIWGLTSPSSMKRVSMWWSRAVLEVNTIVGSIFVLAAIVLWIVVLIDQPLANWLLVMLGILFVWAGTIYFKPRNFQKLLNIIVLDRKPITIRVMSLVTGIIAVFLIWVGIKGI